MRLARILLLFAIGILLCKSGEPSPEPSPKIKDFTGGWGKASGSGSSRRESKFDNFSQDELKKAADLDIPVAITILSLGRSVEGLENIKDRIIDVRITNPNPYPIFFQGRQYKDNKTIKPIWNKLEGAQWVLAGWNWCGTGVRDWDIEANGSIDVMLYLHPELKEQQILGRFYKADKPSIQSDCLLYEKK